MNIFWGSMIFNRYFLYLRCPYWPKSYDHLVSWHCPSMTADLLNVVFGMNLICLFLSDWGVDWSSDTEATGGQGAEGALQAHHQALRYSPHHRHQPNSTGRLSLHRSCRDSCKQCCGSGNRCLFDPWTRNRFSGSRIPTHIFERSVTNFW